MENKNESNNVCKATKPTGAELIAQERKEQLEKHNISLIFDKTNYLNKELMKAAISLIGQTSNISNTELRESLHRAVDKSYRDRLIIAGALIAAEIDRIS